MASFFRELPDGRFRVACAAKARLTWPRSRNSSAEADTNAPAVAPLDGPLSAATARFSRIAARLSIHKPQSPKIEASIVRNPQTRIESRARRTAAHGLAAACRLLRLSVFLWPGVLRPDGSRRAALCPGGARDARPSRLDYAHAGWQALAREAGALLLASHAGLQHLRRQRLGRAPSIRGGCHADGGRGSIFSSALSSRLSTGRRFDGGLRCGVIGFARAARPTCRWPPRLPSPCWPGMRGTKAQQALPGAVFHFPGTGDAGQRAGCAVSGGSDRADFCGGEGRLPVLLQDTAGCRA